MPLSRTEVIDNLFTTTWRNVKKKVIDQVFEITPLFNRLLEGGRIRETAQGGRYIDVPIRVAKADENIKFFGKGDTFGTGEGEFLTQLSFEWRYLGDSMVRYWEDDQKNRGPAKMLDYVDQKIDNHKASLIDKLEGAAFEADASGIGITSLAELISEDPTTGTVGGLNRATYEVLRNQYDDFEGSTIATDLIPAMRSMINNCSKYKAGSQRLPDMIITTQAVYEELEDILEGMQQIHTSKTIQASLGFGDISYKNVPIYWCPQCPAGSMYFLNTEHLQFVIDPFAYFDMGPWKEFSNSRDRVTQILTTCQLTCDNFRKQGVIFNIA